MTVLNFPTSEWTPKFVCIAAFPPRRSIGSAIFFRTQMPAATLDRFMPEKHQPHLFEAVMTRQG
jgi:hypothetical protein